VSEMDRIVVVGASLAGLRAAETLRDEGFAGEIVMLGDEPLPPYDRPPLSKEVLAEGRELDDVVLPLDEDFEATWRLGEAAVALDPAAKEVTTAKGERLAYDGLVVATGSSPRRLAGLEPDGDRVLELRTAADAGRLRRLLRPGAHCLIVGCGFIGIELASSAVALGAQVTMVSPEPPLANVGPLASDTAAALLADAGVTMHVPDVLTALERRADGIRAVPELAEPIVADFAVVAVGAVPNVEWLADSGVELEDGVRCDRCLRVHGAADAVAAGDVANWPNPLFGGKHMRIEHWTNAIEGGAPEARTLLAGKDAEPFASVPSVWSDHFGTRFQAAGRPSRSDRFEIVAGSLEERKFAAAAIAEEELVGAVVYGMPREFARLKGRLKVELSAGQL
jgi:3-phenylpropionate/trans-cinnamate dioxygenase ferredoxin reductase component